MKRSTYALRRLLALVLVLVMVGSLFAGCNKLKKNDETEPNDETIQQTGAPTEEPTQAPTEEPTEAPTEPVVTEPPVIMGTVNADNLNVRAEPYSTSDILKRLAINTRIEILEQKIVDGVNWGRIAEGWVNLNYVTIDGEDGPPVIGNDNNIDDGTTPGGTNPGVTNPGTSTTGVISAEELNIRQNPDADSASVGTYKKGDQVTILETSGNWGRTNKGWINMKYVDTTGTSSSGGSTGGSSGGNTTTVSNGNTAIHGYGTVINTTSLAVRSGPGANYSQVSFIRLGERHPYYQTSTNGWVRLAKGWVNADYLKLEYVVESGTEGTINASEVSVREEADYNSTKLATYKKGDKVTILETKGTWGLVEYTSGQYGWVDLDKVTLPKPVSSNYSTGIATVTADYLHIREKASATSDALGTYKKGDKVEVTEVSGNWGKTVDGWINLKYTKMDKTYTTGTGTVTAGGLNIRALPDADSTDLGTLKKGATVTILDTEGTWGKIEYATGKYGWISLNYVQMTSTSGSGSGSGSTTGSRYSVTVQTPGNGTAKASSTSATAGTTITITATPATGYVLGSVEVKDAKGSAVAVVNDKTFSMPASNVTVTVNFVLATEYAINLPTSITGGTIVATVGGNTVTKAAAGQKVVLSITPSNGYSMSALSVKKNGASDTVSVSSNSFTMPAYAVDVNVSFAVDATTQRYEVKVNDTAPIGKAIVTPSTTSAAKGEKVTLNITPDEGYSVNTVIVKQGTTNITVSGTGNTRSFVMPEGKVEVNVTLTAGQYNVSTSKTGSGTVTVSSSKCEAGTTVTVTATPADGYIQSGDIKVYGPSNVIVPVSGNSFTMPGYDVTVKVEFIKTPYNVTISKTGNGTATSDKATAGKDDKVTITATPDSGNKLKAVLITAKVGGATVAATASGNKYTFTMPEGGVDVKVTFEAETPVQWKTNIDVNVRASADNTSAIVGTIPAGTVIDALTGSNDSYIYAQIPGTSLFGYIGTWNLTKQ